jgi:hypothetical protein
VEKEVFEVFGHEVERRQKRKEVGEVMDVNIEIGRIEIHSEFGRFVVGIWMRCQS